MPDKRLIALAVAGALVLAACGSDDSGSTADTTSTTAASSGETTTSAAEATTTTAAAPTAWAVDTSKCDDPEAATAPIEGDIKIGTSMPLSGGPAALFAPFADGIKARYEAENAKGGVDGHKLVPVIKDDQYDAKQTVTAVQGLVDQDKVSLLSGIIGSANNLAVQDDLNAQCIPQLNAATGANWGKVDEYPWTTGVLVPYPVEARVWIEYVKSIKPDAKNAAIFYVKNEFGQAYADSFKADLEAEGMTLVSEQTIEATDSGAPTAQITNIAAAKPDFILSVPLGAQCIGFMKELANAKAANAGFDPPTYLTATCANKIFFGAAGDGGEGVYTSSNLRDVNNPELQASDAGVKDYLAAFKATGSQADPGGIAGAGWLAADVTIAILKEASASADGLTRASIIDAARNLDYVPPLVRDGLTFKMSGADDAFYAEGTQVLQWKSGGFVDQGSVIDLEGQTKFPG